MILTCGKCATRFMVEQSELGPAGRWVRCANCGHEWFEEPARLVQPPVAPAAPPPLAPPVPQAPVPQAPVLQPPVMAPPSAPKAPVAPPIAPPAPAAPTMPASTIPTPPVAAKPAPTPVTTDTAPKPELPKPAPKLAAKSALEDLPKPPSADLTKKRALVPAEELSALGPVAAESQGGAAKFLGALFWITLLLGLGMMIYFSWNHVTRLSDWLMGAARQMQQQVQETVSAAPRAPELELSITRSETVFENQQPVLLVDGQIRNIGARELAIPETIVTLHNDAGIIIAERPVTIAVNSLPPGEAAAFSLRIENPPEAARDVQVRLKNPSPQ